MKKLLDRIFIDGLGGMAQGLFATLIIGTIIQQSVCLSVRRFLNLCYGLAP